MKFYKILGLSLLSMFVFTVSSFNYDVSAEVKTPVKKDVTVNYLSASPLNVVNNPSTYLNKNITFDAEFVAFSSLGLDYKPALKESRNYIGILIKRDDVKTNVIPLSEMKIFMSREMAEKHLDLDQGDKVKISGKVFSTALGDPWVEIEEFQVLTPKAKKEDKK